MTTPQNPELAEAVENITNTLCVSLQRSIQYAPAIRDCLITHLSPLFENAGKAVCAYCGKEFVRGETQSVDISKHVVACEKNPFLPVIKEQSDLIDQLTTPLDELAGALSLATIHISPDARHAINKAKQALQSYNSWKEGKKV